METASPLLDELGEGQVLLRVLAGGICGSDLPFFRGDGSEQRVGLAFYSAAPAGFPMHEVVGEVLASRDDGLAPGIRVVGWVEGSHGLAELAVAEGSDLVPCGGELDPAHAVMAQPLACVLGAMLRVGSVERRSVAVLGLGPIGVLFSHVAKNAGAAEVIGVDLVDRRDVVSVFGVDRFVHASSTSWARTLSDEDRPEIVVEAVGHQDGTFVDAVNAVQCAGQLYYFGIPARHDYRLDMTQFLRKQLTMRAGTTINRRDRLVEALRYLDEHTDLIDAYITDTYPIGEVQSGFEAAIHPRPGQLKITLDMTT